MPTDPTKRPNWVLDLDPAKTDEPDGSKKTLGFTETEKPTFEHVNWLFAIISLWFNRLINFRNQNILISDDSVDRDFATIRDYIDGSPAAGDELIIKNDEVLTGTLNVPAGVTLRQKRGKKLTLATNFSPVISLAAGARIEGELEIENSDTGTIAVGVSILGDDVSFDTIKFSNLSTGTITDAVRVQAGVKGTKGYARVFNTGGGGITNSLLDDSGNDANHVIVRDFSSGSVTRSIGSKFFDLIKLVNFGSITDDQGNKILSFVRSSDPVNYYEIGNANAGDGPDLRALGADTNIDVKLTPKGTGGLVVALIKATTLLTPTIASFVNGLHTHGSAASGGPIGSSFRAHKNAGDQAITTGVNTKVTFDTEDWDTNSDFSGSRHTPTIEGKYRYSVKVGWGTNGVSSGSLVLMLWKNGANYSQTSIRLTDTGGHKDVLAEVADMNPGDYMEVYVLHSDGIDRSISNSTLQTSFSGNLVFRDEA